MGGVKFLFEGWRKASIFQRIFSLLFAVGTALMPFLNHEKLGSDDYLFPKFFIFVPAIFLMTITIAFGFCDLSAKLVRSFPFAKQLYTKSVPLFTIILRQHRIIIVVRLRRQIFRQIVQISLDGLAPVKRNLCKMTENMQASE